MATKAQKTKEQPAPVRIDLGCGNNKREGFTGVDLIKTDAVDIVFDLDRPKWTFAKDNSVDEIHCSHFIEHTADLIAFMGECHRILKPGGQMVVIAPYYTSIRCWQDPTHKRAISEHTFLYFNRQWREMNGLTHSPSDTDFDFNFNYFLDPAWAARSDEAKAFAIKHYWNVVSDIQVALTKR